MRWTDIEEIADELEEEYSDEDISSLSMSEIKEMVLSISDFEDHNTEPSENILEEIRDAWLSLKE